MLRIKPEAGRLVEAGRRPSSSPAAQREVLDHHPTAHILLLDADPRLNDVPGTHVKNIVDPIVGVTG
ncbi:hypothetical protein ACFY8O_14155 [Streptomyces argenteolus]|uniref:AAA domain-containing protein n=1 Tax=Streptomyces argenteolus TaxID=67274 RepID=A0ABW6X6H3_9ACTN